LERSVLDDTSLPVDTGPLRMNYFQHPAPHQNGVSTAQPVEVAGIGAKRVGGVGLAALQAGAFVPKIVGVG
jgi:hypothetical protein